MKEDVWLCCSVKCEIVEFKKSGYTEVNRVGFSF